jgi:hypothetical protein
MLGTGDGSGTGGQRGFRRLGGTHKTEKRCAHTAIMPTNRAIDAMAAASSKTTRIIRKPPKNVHGTYFLFCSLSTHVLFFGRLGVLFVGS